MGKAVANISRGVLSKSPPKKPGYLEKPDDAAMLAYAKENGLFIEDYKSLFEDKWPLKGIESEVYIENDGKHVIKINNGIYNENWAEFIERIEAHNAYFPSTRYDFIGFTMRDGKLAIVVRQPYKDNLTKPNRPQLKEELEKRGFKNDKTNTI